MEEKIQLFEQVALEFGLSLQEVVDYWTRQGKVKQTLSQTEVEQENKAVQQQNVEDVLVVNPEFPADDVRSRTQLFWYAFEGKKFSPNHDAYPNCQGVVGWINPNPNAPDGDKIYVVLPEQQTLQYFTKFVETGTNDLYDGRANTLKLIKYGKKHNVNFPPAEFAFNYTENGVKKGEAFWPARKQLERVAENCYDIRKSLKLIGGTFEGWLWSSSERSGIYAWGVDASDGDVGNYPKDIDKSVSCFLAY